MIEESKERAADALRRLALDETAKAYVLRHPELYRPLYQAALRFVAGETLEECVIVARSINDQGHAVTIDFMGESTREIAQASDATTEFLRVVDAIRANALNASVSFDLSHLGLVLDEELCFRNASSVVGAASDAGLEVMISAEGVDRTDAVLALHRWLCQRYDNVGITVQAYLYRTAADLEFAADHATRVRVVKGAFDAPENHAMRRGKTLDTAYLRLVQTLLDRGQPCSIATHDPTILGQVRDMIDSRGMDRAAIEFELLKGVTPEQVDALRDSGHRTRIYLPYGMEWYLYLCNRLAEHPPNIFQAIADAAHIGAR